MSMVVSYDQKLKYGHAYSLKRKYYCDVRCTNCTIYVGSVATKYLLKSSVGTTRSPDFESYKNI